MSTDNQNTFNIENLDLYLKELGKEYRKSAGKGMPAEIILIGGAAILANYGFREMTTDVDEIINAASSMKDVVYPMYSEICFLFQTFTHKNYPRLTSTVNLGFFLAVFSQTPAFCFCALLQFAC